ncbi:MAG: TIGR03435 family protein [Vicinamibacterales bacterium]
MIRVSRPSAVLAAALVTASAGSAYLLAAQSARDAFEVASVRPAGDAPGEALAAFGSGCDGSFPRIENNRFRVTTTLFALMTWAYGFNDRGGCSFVTHGGLIVGGPSWVRSERFEIQAVLPDGAPVYSLNQFLNGEATRLEAMLRTLLTERFKLAVRRETREVPVYALVVAGGGARLTPAKPEEPVGFGTRRERDPNGGTVDRMVVSNVNMNRVALMLGLVLRRPVIDRTGLPGAFTFDIRFAPQDANAGDSPAPSIVTAFQEELGLRIEDSRGPVEALVIQSVERPTAN